MGEDETGRRLKLLTFLGTATQMTHSKEETDTLFQRQLSGILMCITCSDALQQSKLLPSLLPRSEHVSDSFDQHGHSIAHEIGQK